MLCSVIVCTRNRAASLLRTLQALEAQKVPAGWQVELIVVDNGSTDETMAAVQSWPGRFRIVLLQEVRPNKSNALNTGLQAAKGEVLLFTDDDVLPSPQWLQTMATPLLERTSDAVSGQLELWPNILRPWMEPMHRVWLAAPDLPEGPVDDLIGANMGIHRSVLERVPAFDPELGPGRLFAEDTLFARQLLAAGFRLRHLRGATALHCPAPGRLNRGYWLKEADKRGQATAYLLHHWEHDVIRRPRLRYLCLLLKLKLRTCLTRTTGDEVAAWELSYRSGMAACSYFLQERKRPRHYTLHGLRKLERP